MFKIGSLYSRKDVGEIYFPGVGRPKGGAWDTGYVRVENDLVIFFNIDVAGTTGHDFDNHYDKEKQIITWFGKPNSHSGQPLFKKLISGELTPHFFARWDNTNPDFTYLGIGEIIAFDDGIPTLDGSGEPATTIKVVLTCRDVDEKGESSPSFTSEKKLEDFEARNISTPNRYYQTALSYIKGKGISQDYKKAFKWFDKAAKEDYPPAYYNLGICYLKGLGVKRDTERARIYFLSAAEKGHQKAKKTLALFCQTICNKCDKDNLLVHCKEHFPKYISLKSDGPIEDKEQTSSKILKDESVKLKEINERLGKIVDGVDDWKSFVYFSELSVRATNVLSNNFSSLEEFLDFDTQKLHTLPSCGRKTVREIKVFLKEIKGDDVFQNKEPDILEILSSEPTKESLKILPLFSSEKIEGISSKDLHPGFQAKVDLLDLPLSFRSHNVLKKAGIKTVGGLLFSTSTSLLNMKNMGRKSIGEIKDIISKFIIQNSSVQPETISPESDVHTIDYTSYKSMISSFAALGIKSARDQKLIIERLCSDKRKLPTLEQLGAQFELSRERARQIKKKGLRQLGVWFISQNIALFWDSIAEIIENGGGVIDFNELAQKIKLKFNWKKTPNIHSLKELINTNIDKVPFIIEANILKIETGCLNCQTPTKKIQSIDFDELGEIHLEVLSKVLSEDCESQCLFDGKKAEEFNKAFIVTLIQSNRSDLVIKNDIVCTERNYKSKYGSAKDITKIVLEDYGKPLHFKKIAEEVANSAIKKKISERVVHNILITSKEFEFYGSGEYGLKIWGDSGYKPVAKAIEGVLLNAKIPLSRQEIVDQLNGQYSEHNVSQALINKKIFFALGDGFYALTEKWQNTEYAELANHLPEQLRVLASFIISDVENSYKPALALVFIRGNNNGSMYLSTAKTRFYNYYYSRFKRGLPVEDENELASKISELTPTEFYNQITNNLILHYVDSGLFENEGGNFKLHKHLVDFMKDSFYRNILMIITLKALNDYFMEKFPSVSCKIRIEENEKHDEEQVRVAEENSQNISGNVIEKSPTTISIKRGKRAKIKI